MKTWDKYTNERIQKLHPIVRKRTIEFINRSEKKLGIQLRVFSAYRSFEEQNELYAKGRTAPGNIVTYAQAGESYHNFGLAIDVVEIVNNKAVWKNPNWPKIGKIGESLGFTWGGRWKMKDLPHFQVEII